jgi:hypothetical protein
VQLPHHNEGQFFGRFELRILRRINPEACVIAQQYSSATIASLRFHSRQEKHGASVKNVISFLFNPLRINVSQGNWEHSQFPSSGCQNFPRQ